jgi:hypothetical protein
MELEDATEDVDISSIRDIISVDEISNKLHLLIENYDESTNRLVELAKNRGFNICLCKQNKVLQYTTENYRPELSNYKTYFFGTLFGYREICKNCILNDVDFRRYDCSSYYNHFNWHLLNEKYVMLPLNDIVRQYDDLLSYFRCNQLFIRPDSSQKPFTGFITDKNYKNEINYHLKRLNSNPMCLIAPKKDILEEYRLVINKKSVVTGCQYIKNGEIDIKSGVPDDIIKHVEGIILSQVSWSPDDIYVLDVCRVETDGPETDIKVVEINALSTSGMYECDLNKILDIIETKYNDYQPNN